MICIDLFYNRRSLTEDVSDNDINFHFQDKLTQYSKIHADLDIDQNFLETILKYNIRYGIDNSFSKEIKYNTDEYELFRSLFSDIERDAVTDYISTIEKNLIENELKNAIRANVAIFCKVVETIDNYKLELLYEIPFLKMSYGYQMHSIFILQSKLIYET